MTFIIRSTRNYSVLSNNLNGIWSWSTNCFFLYVIIKLWVTNIFIVLIICSDEETNNYQTRSLLGYWCYNAQSCKIPLWKMKANKRRKTTILTWFSHKSLHPQSLYNFLKVILQSQIIPWILEKKKKKLWQIQDKLISEC